MDAMEEVLRRKKISYARVDGRCTNNSHLKEAERLRYQRGDAPVILFNVVEGISLHEGETNNGGNSVPRCQIDHDLRWSAIQAHQIDGRSHRDGKFAQVYWVVAKDTIDSRVAEVLLWKLESRAISKEILLRILRKYFLPFKKRAHEGCPHLKGAHLILNEIRSRTVEKRSSWGAGLRRPAYRLRSRPWTTPWDINSMTTRSSAQRR
jgi:hypothetical protein